MAKFSQDNRPLSVTTPLGKDILLLERFTGNEAISELFRFQMVLLATVDNFDTIKFENIIGQAVTVKVSPDADSTPRYFHGIVQRFSQLGRFDGPAGKNTLMRFSADIVPKAWLLSKNVQSRVFQQESVPDILKKVLVGLDVSYQIDGAFKPRDYCTQYRESDLAFAQRLMEEEGLYYFFKHSETGHQMIVANVPAKHLSTGDDVKFEELAGGERPDERVYRWVKNQEIRSGKISLRDFHFEKPEAAQAATKKITAPVTVGTVSHKLKIIESDTFELYNFPSGFAQRFDGVDPGGAVRAADLSNISTDGDRTVGIRLEAEQVSAISIDGESDVRAFCAGYKFKLIEHFDANGSYVLRTVSHDASLGGSYTSRGDEDEYSYKNRFVCMPLELPFRPERKTPKALVEGTQTALVVGPAGEEIFTDKYGRVKVQFHWDRLGKNDANSSCWMRVGTLWAGKQWGIIHIPRIGQEVIVAFEEGDPDQPIIVGSVYNAANMPPYTLPDNKTQSGMKSRSTLQGTAEMFNELRFEDKKESEDIYFHAQKDFHRVVENDDDLKVGRHQTIEIKNNRTKVIKEGDEKRTIEKGNRETTLKEGNDTFTMEKGSRTETLKEGNETLTLEKGARTETLKDGDETVTLEKGARTHTIQNDDTLAVKAGSQVMTVNKDSKLTVETGDRAVTVSQGKYTLAVAVGDVSVKADAGSILCEATTKIELKVGGNSIVIEQAGITIKGIAVTVEGSATADVKSPMTTVAGDGMCTIKGGAIMIG